MDDISAGTEVALREVIEYLRRDQGVFLEEGGLKLYRLLTRLSTKNPLSEEYVEDKICPLIESARRGNWEDHLVVCEIARDMWKKGQRPFVSIEEYIFQALQTSPPRARPGKSPYKNIMRNISIMRAVRFVVTQFGLKLTRNRATLNENPTESACSLVSEALARLGIHLSEHTVKDAYDQWRYIYE